MSRQNIHATGVVLTDVLPAGVTFVSAANCTQASGTVTCTIGGLSAGSSVVRQVVVTPTVATANLANTVSVTRTEPERTISCPFLAK